jgi:hypothetical protein
MSPTHQTHPASRLAHTHSLRQAQRTLADAAGQSRRRVAAASLVGAEHNLIAPTVVKTGSPDAYAAMSIDPRRAYRASDQDCVAHQAGQQLDAFGV